jgi:hypothetical protein
MISADVVLADSDIGPYVVEYCVFIYFGQSWIWIPRLRILSFESLHTLTLSLPLAICLLFLLLLTFAFGSTVSAFNAFRRLR